MKKFALLSGLTLGVNAVNPVTRVAELLTGMSEQAEKDQKMEEKMFKKYACWFKKTTEEKTQSNAAAEARIEELTLYIDDVKNGRIEFTDERKNLEKEVAETMKALEKNQAIRDQQQADFEAAEEEMNKGITALDSAIATLNEKANLGGSLLAKRFNLRKAVELANGRMSVHDYRWMMHTLDVPEKDWEKLNKDAEFKQKYQARSGKIQAALADMLNTFKSNLEQAIDKNNKAIDSHETLKASLEEQRDNAKQALADMKEENGARGLALADAEAEVDNLTTQVEEDTQYMKEIKDDHDKKKANYKDRQNVRAQEIAAIGKAISILRSDDARDLFKKSFESQGGSNSFMFLQTKKKLFLHRQSAPRKARALALIRSAIRKYGHKGKFIRSLSMMQTSSIAKVIEMIDDMVKDLKDEAEEDAKKKEVCEEDAHNYQKDAWGTSRDTDDNIAKIARLEALIADKKAQIAENQEQIKKVEAQMKEAEDVRADEKREYDSSKKDDEMALDLVDQAKAALTDFYGEFIQVEASQPKVVEGEYAGQTGEGAGVVGLLTMIGQDIEKDIKAADKEEEDSIAEFDKFMKDSQDDIDTMDKVIADAEDAIATADQDRLAEEETKKSNEESIKADTDGYLALRKNCDFYTVNFEARKEMRAQEKDGLLKAKSILQGASESDA